MKVFAGHSKLWLLLVPGLCLGLAGTLHAQLPVSSPDRAVAAAQVPALPQLKSPVDQFRELLALPAAERASHLTNKPPALRQRILAKVAEYEAMKPDERELRLRSTQLRWYLMSFREAPISERKTQLAMVPEADRQVVKDHLDTWDKLPADIRQEILKYEKVMETVLLPGATNVNRMPPPVPNTENLKSINAFLQLPPEKRRQMYASFQEFFELSDAERERTIGALPPEERMQMTLALRKFDKLPKLQRDRCLKSFAKFSSMSEAERLEFLKNAERWRELPTAERQAWRDLINKVAPAPPLPPVLAFPPLPPRASLQVNVPAPLGASQ